MRSVMLKKGEKQIALLPKLIKEIGRQAASCVLQASMIDSGGDA